MHWFARIYVPALSDFFLKLMLPGGVCAHRSVCGVWCVHVRACDMQSFWLPAAHANGCGNAAEQQELTDLPLVAPRSDGQPYCCVGEGG